MELENLSVLSQTELPYTHFALWYTSLSYGFIPKCQNTLRISAQDLQSIPASNM